jgi:hypothetical protein
MTAGRPRPAHSYADAAPVPAALEQGRPPLFLFIAAEVKHKLLLCPEGIGQLGGAATRLGTAVAACAYSSVGSRIHLVRARRRPTESIATSTRASGSAGHPTLFLARRPLRTSSLCQAASTSALCQGVDWNRFLNRAARWHNPARSSSGPVRMPTPGLARTRCGASPRGGSAHRTQPGPSRALGTARRGVRDCLPAHIYVCKLVVHGLVHARSTFGPRVGPRPRGTVLAMRTVERVARHEAGGTRGARRGREGERIPRYTARPVRRPVDGDSLPVPGGLSSTTSWLPLARVQVGSSRSIRRMWATPAATRLAWTAGTKLDRPGTRTGLDSGPAGWSSGREPGWAGLGCGGPGSLDQGRGPAWRWSGHRGPSGAWTKDRLVQTLFQARRTVVLPGPGSSTKPGPARARAGPRSWSSHSRGWTDGPRRGLTCRFGSPWWSGPGIAVACDPGRRWSSGRWSGRLVRPPRTNGPAWSTRDGPMDRRGWTSGPAWSTRAGPVDRRGPDRRSTCIRAAMS